jgi:hypothetical protein
MSGAEYVTFDTSVGSFTVELYTKHAPKVGSLIFHVARAGNCTKTYHQTCNNFSKLAERGYYNGVIFHRIIPVGPPANVGASECGHCPLGLSSCPVVNSVLERIARRSLTIAN